MEKEIGISIVALQKKYGDARALEIASEIGADAVDFSLHRNEAAKADSIYSKGDAAVEEYYRKLGERAKEIGIKVGQTHGRIRGFARDEEENRRIAEDARLDALATASLGAPYCVVHTVATGRTGTEITAEEMHDINFRMFDTILPFARKYGIRILTETLGDAAAYNCIDFFGSIPEMEKAVRRILDAGYGDCFGVCMDTGHTNKAARFEGTLPPAAIRRLGGQILALHLNDNNSMTDEHKVPGMGNIDWKDVFAALEEISYRGIYNMELNLTHFGADFEIEEAAFAIRALRNLLR